MPERDDGADTIFFPPSLEKIKKERKKEETTRAAVITCKSPHGQDSILHLARERTICFTKILGSFFLFFFLSQLYSFPPPPP